ncbi:hypothetical protein GCM10011613_31590 [Cellvibrio zantedeschiae]|uniref:Uncharacterized protein n=1 Tax=Cellvibrio zantedeschiae TaxID=1237077 RepID=A0ABQ3B8W6_9GAMM|nr:DUF6683 family protein [Cellvibrio zantedeschiae]GGY84346.1 hypothetical protein GCM10011613_31590 [Cellvibrio zantedeschiae]
MDATINQFIRLIKTTVAVTLLYLINSSAHAQWLGADYATYGVPQVNYAANSFLNFSVLNNASGEAASSEVSTLAPRVGRSTTAADLAARYPGGAQAQLTQIFTESLTNFEQVAARLGLPKDDVAAALAAFLVGNYIAMKDTALPADEDFIALTKQLRASLASSHKFAKASPSQKRQAYEQLAMMGMFMTTAQMALTKTPNPQAQTHFQNHAKANLEQLLKRSADTLEIKGGQLNLH